MSRLTCFYQGKERTRKAMITLTITQGQWFANAAEDRWIRVIDEIQVPFNNSTRPYWEVELFVDGKSKGLAIYTDAQISRWFPLRGN
jgi:hypothetical protein